MKKVFAFLMFVGVIALAACGSTGGSDDGSGCGGECSGGCSGSSKMDNSQSTIDMYVNGTQKAMYWVTVHENPEAGQYWETSSDMSGMKMTTHWQVSKVDGNTAIIEQEQMMDSEYMVSDYVIAYKVDLSVEAGGVNVTAAWVGKPGEDGTAIEVMEMPEATCGGCAPEVESTTEDFSDLALADGTWAGKVTTTNMNGTESKVWMADNGWFGGMVKMQSGDYVTELTKYGTDAEPLLKGAE
ncbi:MAG: hypothetical protein KDB82_14310 [Planctomycetes bacterium]|nr:hypothetical protein [Planctomycetota bacterium]